MRKLLAITLVAGFLAVLMAPAALAMGDCSGKSQGGTKTADQPKPTASSA